MTIILILLLVTGLGANYLRPLPSVAATISLPRTQAAEPITLQWPNGGQAAIGAEGYGLLASSGAQTPLATASIAKVITALCVLQKYPLSPGQQGPTLTLTGEDLQIYNNYAADGSVVQVYVGEQLSEYQMLQGLLLPSANNLADSLAIWAFGSLANYKAYATSFLLQNGLTATHLGSDASGYGTTTVSTANDLVKLGLLATRNAVLAEIASQPSAPLPMVGTVSNYNTVLGQSGITGLKTGNNSADPGAFLFSANVQVGSKPLVVVGAIMGQPDLETALQSSIKLVATIQANFDMRTIIPNGKIIASYKAPWGATTVAIAKQPVSLLRWKGDASLIKYTAEPILPGQKSKTVGSIEVSAGNMLAASPLELKQPLEAPSFWWRLTRH
ncbi:MAG: hypothetical protein WC498_00820 [Candidatus Saccharimonadales bacterium]